MNRKEQMREACQIFHDSHPRVWHLFVSFTMQKYNRGFKNYGAKAVMERVRWETDAGNPIAPGLDFKLNNNHTAFYAERFNKMYPEVSDGNFFRTRKMQVNRGSHPVPTLEGRGFDAQ